MNTIERVLHFLRKRPDRPYCDECLAIELRVRHPLSRMLDVLSADYFRRGTVTCDRCGMKKHGIVQVWSDEEGPIKLQ
jgi:hypothetical protein